MYASTLNKKLDKIIYAFRDEMQFHLDGLDEDKPMTKKDMEAVSREVFYTFTEFKKVLVDDLRDNEH